jgi:hypothetical protein
METRIANLLCGALREVSALATKFSHDRRAPDQQSGSGPNLPVDAAQIGVRLVGDRARFAEFVHAMSRATKPPTWMSIATWLGKSRWCDVW